MSVAASECIGSNAGLYEWFESVAETLQLYGWWQSIQDVGFDQAWSAFPVVIQTLLFVWLLYLVHRVINARHDIHNIIKDIIKSRGPIWELKTTIDDLKESTTKLAEAQPEIRNLSEQVETLTRRMQAMQERISEDQRHEVADELPIGDLTSEGQELWRKLRYHWYFMTGQLDARIDQHLVDLEEEILAAEQGTPTEMSGIERADAEKALRTKKKEYSELQLKYEAMSRRSYKRLIAAMKKDGMLTDAQADQARIIDKAFLAARRRKEDLSAEIVGPVEIAATQLKAELPTPDPKRLPDQD